MIRHHAVDRSLGERGPQLLAVGLGVLEIRERAVDRVDAGGAAGHHQPEAGVVPDVAGIAIGLADGFQREVQVVNPDGTITTEILEDLPASERFFAGGDTTMRGFALDSVGTAATVTEGGFPRGGNGLVLFNAEIRVPVWNMVEKVRGRC